MPGIEEYKRQLISLFPRGRLWTFETLGDFLTGAATELTRVDVRAAEGLAETDPNTVNETLEEWEEQYGLDGTGTTTERKSALISRVVRKWRTRPVDYQDKFASILGFTDPEDVVVIEISAAEALAMGDQKQIYQFYIYRDPGLAGSFLLSDAEALLEDFVHSHTRGTVIENTCFLCDDPLSLCDKDILACGVFEESMLQEDQFRILTEDGDRLILE